jgi:hypothetical protein
MPAQTYQNRQRRTFKLTKRGAYVINTATHRLYARRAKYVAGVLIKILNSVPVRIRPRYLPKK